MNTAITMTDSSTGNTATRQDRHILKFPYKTAAGEVLEQLALRKLTVGDLRAVKRQFTDVGDRDEALVARMCGLVIEDLEGMDLRDYQELSARFRKSAGLADG